MKANIFLENIVFNTGDFVAVTIYRQRGAWMCWDVKLDVHWTCNGYSSDVHSL